MSAKRRRRTPAERLAILERQGGLCAACGEALEIGDTHLDHVNPLWVSGDDTDGNLEAIHVACHREKTPRDVKVITKIKRLIARNEGTRKARKAIPSRPFVKCRPFPKRKKERLDGR